MADSRPPRGDRFAAAWSRRFGRPAPGKVIGVLEHASSAFTLDLGGVILSGTPAGVGVFKDSRISLQPGDVEIEIDGIGVLRYPVVAEA